MVLKLAVAYTSIPNLTPTKFIHPTSLNCPQVWQQVLCGKQTTVVSHNCNHQNEYQTDFCCPHPTNKCIVAEPTRSCTWQPILERHSIATSAQPRGRTGKENRNFSFSRESCKVLPNVSTSSIGHIRLLTTLLHEMTGSCTSQDESLSIAQYGSAYGSPEGSLLPPFTPLSPHLVENLVSRVWYMYGWLKSYLATSPPVGLFMPLSSPCEE